MEPLKIKSINEFFENVFFWFNILFIDIIMYIYVGETRKK